MLSIYFKTQLLLISKHNQKNTNMHHIHHTHIPYTDELSCMQKMTSSTSKFKWGDNADKHVFLNKNRDWTLLCIQTIY